MGKGKIVKTLALTSVLFLAAGCGSGKPEVLGRFQPNGAPLPLQKLHDQSKELIQREVTVMGQVAQVCPTAGCWLQLEDGTHSLHVELVGFTVLRNREGFQCRAQGKLVEKGGRLTLLARGILLEK